MSIAIVLFYVLLVDLCLLFYERKIPYVIEGGNRKRREGVKKDGTAQSSHRTAQ